MALIIDPHTSTIITPEGAFVPQPTTTIELNMEQLRLLSKSVSKTIDAELKKMSRLRPGRLLDEVRADYEMLDEVDVEIRSAISEMVGRSREG